MATFNSTVTLYMNTINRSISYKNMTKEINDTYWESEIIPLLYPLWHSDRDRLEVFSAFSDGKYHITRNKYVRNHKEATGKWVSYEFEYANLDKEAADALKSAIIDKFLAYKESLERDIESTMEREFVSNKLLSWEKIRLIRNFLLEESDFIMMPDYSISDEEKAMWIDYRQYLRDIPTIGFANPFEVSFPITPNVYLERKQVDLPEDHYGDQGRNDPYLENTDYHFWKPTSNTLENWNQRMALYVALKLRTLPNGKVQNVFTTRSKKVFGQNTLADEQKKWKTSEDYINSLLEAIEEGRV